MRVEQRHKFLQSITKIFRRHDITRLIDADKLLLSTYWHGESWAQDKPYAANGVDAVDVCDIEAAPTIEIIEVRELSIKLVQTKNILTRY